jgi:predicted ester cyclase
MAQSSSGLQFKAFPNGKRRIESQIAEDDQVVTRISVDLPHEGDFLGIQPTGRTIHVTAIVIYRLDNGKIVEGWMEQAFEHQREDMTRQIGEKVATNRDTLKAKLEDETMAVVTY